MSVVNPVVSFDKGYVPDPREPLFTSIFQQYERVLIESLITSFGLDFIVKDQHGGDVDTIHNVRQIGVDPEMTYKNVLNQQKWEQETPYSKKVKAKYDSDLAFQRFSATASRAKKGGDLVDSYTGKPVARNADIDIDHVIATKEIHDDRGRVLAGLNGIDLANQPENLRPTDRSINRSMKEKSIDEYLQWLDDTKAFRQSRITQLEEKSELTSKEVSELKKLKKQNEINPELMKNNDKTARKANEARINTAYYTSPNFRKDMTYAAMNIGTRMGVRQAVGFVFAEIWFAVKDELQKSDEKGADLKTYMEAVANGFQNGLRHVREKYPELCSRFLNGAVAGALSSMTTTLCNIFFTTAKSTVRIIRQSYASVVQAMEVLFINPDNYEFGDRMRAVVNILSIGASVTVGVLVSDAIAHTPLGALGKTGEIVQSFCGAFVTGIMSCTLLMYLDRSELMNTLVRRLNDIHTIETELNYYREWAKYFEQYAAQLMQIDLEQFEKEGEAFRAIASRLDDIQTEDELNQTLKQAFTSRNLPLPWADFPDFNAFMSDKSAHLVFQ